ncbi:MAG: bifunctional DNA primase/polymerase, partial [Chloroflexota bacterium]|nr:bifunctional DNA primase/polymerase [Chloroflexota bacterium]
MFATVARYRDAGLSTFPIRKGTKSPAVRSWREFQERLPCWHQLAAWFAGPRACRSLAIVCGRVSDNLTVIDFDAPELYQPWYDLCRMCGVDLSAIAAIVATPSGGRHVYIHGPAPDGNQKLACAADGSTLIETRGTGGYVLAPPSPGYTVLGGDVASRNQADAETLDAMLDCARAFDAKPVVETCAAGVIPTASRGQVEGGPRTPSPG